MINNGDMRIESNELVSSSVNPLTLKETTSNSMYQVGWNLLCYINDGTYYTFVSFPHFETTYISEMTSTTAYYFSSSTFWGVFGGSVSNGTTEISNTLNGIMNKIYIKSVSMIEDDITSSIINPMSDSATLCDYFTSMFTGLGPISPNHFINLMSRYNSQYKNNLID